MDPKELLDLMKSRRSVRRFQDRPIPREEVERLVDAARWAPSNHNRQAWRFLVFESRERLAKLAGEVRAALLAKRRDPALLASELLESLAGHASWFGEAPCVVLVLHRKPLAVAQEIMEGVPHPELVSGEPLSAAMAVQNLLLAAHAAGLGACVLTAPLLAPEAFERECPAGFEPLCLVALGYPAEEPNPPRRKSLEQVIEFKDPT